MEGIFHTLHDFMVHTKAVTYLLIIAALVGITGWWGFLTERDQDEHPQA